MVDSDVKGHLADSKFLIFFRRGKGLQSLRNVEIVRLESGYVLGRSLPCTTGLHPSTQTLNILMRRLESPPNSSPELAQMARS